MTHKRTYLAARALLLIVASIGPTAALAQTTAAQITGIVKDPTGAMIPGANVRIENQQTGNFLLTVTSDEGRYLFRSLEPGNYSLTVSMPSFKTQTLTDVVLHVAQSARLDIALEVGQPSETLTVTETTPLLESEGAAVGSIITTQQLTELPLNGRNFVGLAILAPARPTDSRTTTRRISSATAPRHRSSRPTGSGQNSPAPRLMESTRRPSTGTGPP